MAGAFDNEAVAIFAMVTTFYLFVASVRTGSVLRASLASVSYFYMVSTWGGYTYVANLLPLYVVTSVIYGLYTPRLYVAYSIFYTVGTLLSMQIAFVGFQAVRTMEHMLPMAAFLLLQVRNCARHFSFNTYPVATWILSSIPETGRCNSIPDLV